MNRYHTQLIDQLDSSGEQLLYFFAQIPATEIHRLPGGAEWSLHATLAHVRDVQVQVLLKRLRAILKSSTPPTVENFDQLEWTRKHYKSTESLPQIVREIRSSRRAAVKLLRATTDRDWARVALHPEYGKISIEWLLLHNYAHTIEHLQQFVEHLESAALAAPNNK